jgi:Peptidase A4 family
MRSKPLLILALLAALPALAQEPNAPASTSNDQPAIHLRRHAPMKLVGVPRPGSVTSSNWSGYAVTGTAFTKALGSWIVPKVKCGTTPNSYSSYWIGLDGYSDNTVEQIGTDSDCSGTSPVYYAWFEFYPNASRLISNITVSPGDKMSATVSYNGSEFTLQTTDHTTGKVFKVVNKGFKGKRTSAEWIVEAPSDSLGVLPLADFTSASLGTDYTGVHDTDWAVDSAVTGPISDFGSKVQKITMETTSYLKAVPSALTTDGSSFKVSWKHE